MGSQNDVIAGQYHLVNRLGYGGMGEVYLAQDLNLARQVAVKLLLPNNVEREERRHRDRFRREARTTGTLGRSRHFPQVHAFGEHEGEPFLVMEFIEGPTLEELAEQHHPLPFRGVIAILAQLATALASLHDAGLVHRDLKPSNVMIAPGGVVKVMDLGIVAHTDPFRTRITTTGGAAPGTVAYAAPEQVTEGRAEPRSDLYSLGCIVFELVTGEYLFTAETAYAMARCHADEPPRRIADVRPQTPPWLAETVDRLLCKNPDLRPGDARALFDLVRPHLAVLESAGCPGLGDYDPTLPWVRPCSPPPLPKTSPSDVRRRQGSDLDDLARRQKRTTELRRDDLSRIRAEAGTFARDGDLRGAVQLIDQCLDSAVGRFGRIESGVVRLRIDRAALLREEGLPRDAYSAYTEVRPDAVRAFGEPSPEVREIDDGIERCAEDGGPH
ncbi:protein kinase [Streptomyces sp. Tu 6176]|uniref:serine/threonine-protein kinase n=1 Tax=Streptomyces sp. Tu 6176 TaxID=1470557 RepID=UPI00044B6EC8|nr:serine/threonine-protein kinase [Streptomyces sp. Tu 6176]EYT83317.1 protein kinase [Streptomyces sp. Tu 6176]